MGCAWRAWSKNSVLALISSGLCLLASYFFFLCQLSLLHLCWEKKTNVIHSVAWTICRSYQARQWLWEYKMASVTISTFKKISTFIMVIILIYWCYYSEWYYRQQWHFKTKHSVYFNIHFFLIGMWEWCLSYILMDKLRVYEWEYSWLYYLWWFLGSFLLENTKAKCVAWHHSTHATAKHGWACSDRLRERSKSYQPTSWPVLCWDSAWKATSEQLPSHLFEHILSAGGGFHTIQITA